MIKKFRTPGREFVLPERNSVTMTAPFMRAYTELLVKTCHRRGAHAMGGMAAFIPSRRDPEVNAKALAKVREDKTRESQDGFDGSWVAHPDLVPICKEVFDSVLGANPNQLAKTREDVSVTAQDLLAVSKTPGVITEGGAAQRHQRRAAVPGQLAGRQRGGGHLQPDGGRGHRGDLPLPGLAVDPQRRHPGRRHPGDQDLVERLIDEELTKIRALTGEDFDAERYGQAVALFSEVGLADSFVDFLTIPAYERMP